MMGCPQLAGCGSRPCLEYWVADILVSLKEGSSLLGDLPAKSRPDSAQSWKRRFSKAPSAQLTASRISVVTERAMVFERWRWS